MEPYLFFLSAWVSPDQHSVDARVFLPSLSLSLSHSCCWKPTCLPPPPRLERNGLHGRMVTDRSEKVTREGGLAGRAPVAVSAREEELMRRPPSPAQPSQPNLDLTTTYLCTGSYILHTYLHYCVV